MASADHTMATTMSLPSTVQRVFKIIELAQTILDTDESDLKQLYLLQRVNTTFRDVINASKALQTRMWAECPSTQGDLSRVQINPLLLHGPGQLPIFRPFSISFNGFTRNKDGFGEKVVAISCSTRRPEKLTYFAVLDAFMKYPGGESWESMKVSNGPCVVSLKINIGVGYVVTSSNGFFELEEGATLGDLVWELKRSHRMAHAKLARRAELGPKHKGSG